ncbi:MAG: hypothetical protein LUD72_00860 [Bacteroidales bacterium]|nr:hypothetical protein [Bacteroidales bacterium]
MFGGSANNSNAGWRYSNSDNQPSNSNTNYGGGSSASINNRAKNGEATPAW